MSFSINRGQEKMHGLENAQFQKQKHLIKNENHQENFKKNVENSSGVKLEISSKAIGLAANKKEEDMNQVSSENFSTETKEVQDSIIVENGAKVNIESNVGTDDGNDTLVVKSGAKVNIESNVGIDNGNDTLVVENGAKVNIQSNVGIDNGNDTLVVESGAKVNIQSNVEVDNGNNTLVIGKGAKVDINQEIGDQKGDGKIVVANGSDIEISGKLQIGKSEEVTYLEGKVRIQLKDENQHFYRLEVEVNNKDEAKELVNLLKEKMGQDKGLKWDELKEMIQKFKEDKKVEPADDRFNIKKSSKNDEHKMKVDKSQVEMQMKQDLLNALTEKFNENKANPKPFRQFDMEI